MVNKFTKLISIIIVMLLVLSCNLLRTATQTTVPGAQPLATQPSESTAPQSGQPAQTRKNNPSDFKGGITAKAGYKLALPKALEWSSTAVLSEIAQTTINMEGKSQSWIYYFADDTLKSAQDRNQGYFVIVGEKGVTEAKPGNINVGEKVLQASADDWTIDGGEALAACDQAGGARLRAANPDMYMESWLMVHDYPANNNMPQPSSKNIFWTIDYKLNGKGQLLNCEVDGNNGKVFLLNAGLDINSSSKPITAKAGYQAALAPAQEWNPGATLLDVRVEFPSGDKTWPIGGVAEYWHYTFIVLPEPKDGDYQPDYEVVVGSNGLMSFRGGSTYTGHAAIGSQADWSIDSDEAFRISEANGGKAFRDQHTNAIFGMELRFAFNPVETLNTTKNVR